MTIGGITYPTSPVHRLVPRPRALAPATSATSTATTCCQEIAEAFGIDTSDRRSLWKDRAVIEMTTAVLHSYDQAGMRMDDHYTATEKFHKWVQAEAKKGREVEAEWTWMIPPISASLTPVFHQEYSNVEKLPNFVQSPRADVARRAGRHLPVHGRDRHGLTPRRRRNSAAGPAVGLGAGELRSRRRGRVRRGVHGAPGATGSGSRSRRHVL